VKNPKPKEKLMLNDFGLNWN